MKGRHAALLPLLLLLSSHFYEAANAPERHKNLLPSVLNKAAVQIHERFSELTTNFSGVPNQGPLFISQRLQLPFELSVRSYLF